MPLHPVHKLSVLMPIFNEARTLRVIVDRVLHSPVQLPIELVIVDDGSTDGSREILAELAVRESRIHALYHHRNQGKTAAVRTAIRAMTGDVALIQDADLEYNPEDYPALLAPILDGIADVVFGSRFLCGSHRRVLYFWHAVANRLLTLICNVLNNVYLTDMETGYKVIRADVLKAIPLTSTGFALEPELTTKLVQWDLRIYEVPISYRGRTYAEGKKIRLKDAVAALWAIVRYRYLSRRFATHEGFLTLQNIRKAHRFNHWVCRQFASYLGRHVLEAGCGVGNLSDFLLDRERLICIDKEPFYLERVADRFAHLENVSTQLLDLASEKDYLPLRQARLDTIICINVLEHMKNDDDVLRNFHDVLMPGGHVVLLVPAHPWLYGPTDAALGHCRRYTFADIRHKLRQSGFDVVECRGFNRLGSLGWWLSSRLLRNRHISPGKIKAFEWLVPLAKALERLPVLPHLSILAVGQKPLSVAQDIQTNHADSGVNEHRATVSGLR